jgi:MFS transporter, ACDE family, multidrug resistance protein
MIQKCGDRMNISRKQLIVLFICTLIPLMIGLGLTPLLPVYAESLGADSIVAGLYLAVVSLALTAGALSAGWISGSRFRRKLPYMIAISLCIPFYWALGRMTSLIALILFTSLLWFLGGLGLALCSILTGLSAGKDERGKVFGVIGLTSGLGAIVGGLGIGWMVKQWGYPTMFSALAVFSLIGFVAALFLEEKEDQPSQIEEDQPPVVTPLGRHYFLLFSASLVLSVSSSIFILIRSLSMSGLGFDALEISSAGVVGGLVSFPLPFLLGWLSDRIGRKKVLFLACLSLIVALLLLPFSRALWHFWLVSIIMGIQAGSMGSAGNALVMDLVIRQSIGKGLALFGATAWFGGIIGFALAGFMMQKLSISLSCYFGCLLVVAAVGLLIPIKVAGELVSQHKTGSAH